MSVRAFIGYGFKCWLCSSQMDRRCGDPFNSTDVLRHEECNSGYYPNSNTRFVCRKVKYRGGKCDVYHLIIHLGVLNSGSSKISTEY